MAPKRCRNSNPSMSKTVPMLQPSGCPPEILRKPR